VALAAGKATLAELATGAPYSHIEDIGAAFDEAVKTTRTPGVRWVRHGPIVWAHLGAGAPPTRDDQLDSSVKPAYARLFHRWLEAGIYFPPSAFEVGFLCAAHSAEDVRRLVEVSGGEG
jgi:glutamate-1-semialdehyde 2,1-aminomutase